MFDRKLKLLCLLILPSLCPAADALNGAGATFPAPLYAKWIDSFRLKNANTEIRYEPTGSEEGIRRLKDGLVDFAASDIPLSDERLATFTNKPLQVATVAGAVVPIFNIPGVPEDLRLTPEALAGIFLGNIKKWNDPAIQSSNRGVALPAKPIVVIHRIDGSGTTFVLSEYLSRVSALWNQKLGVGSTLTWPTGETATGNEGVASAVTHTSNSIGYAEFIYAVQHRLAFASVRNSAGHFTQASIASIQAATATATGIPDDFRVSIADAPGAEAYPISSFTWLLIPSTISDPVKKAKLYSFLTWILSSGQREAAALGYVSLPSDLIEREQRMLDRQHQQ